MRNPEREPDEPEWLTRLRSSNDPLYVAAILLKAEIVSKAEIKQEFERHEDWITIRTYWHEFTLASEAQDIDEE